VESPEEDEKPMINAVFNVPIDERYFEDYEPGSIYEFGSIVVMEEEIIEFAKRYDPQTFHTDPIAARKSGFGGLIASGWHTAALTMRLLVDNYISHVASLGSPGADELRWHKPVRPGDELYIRVRVLETRRSKSKPDRGIIRSFVEVLNQNREVVMTRTALGITLCRNRE
jgi:acyl dehydratase